MNPVSRHKEVREGEFGCEHSRFRRFLKLLGPGFITGASDDDPSGVGTYAVVGAKFGYAVLWTAWITLPLMAAVQFMASKIALVTGEGLAGVLRRHYPKSLLYPVVISLLVANTINAGVDIGAIAAAVNLLVPVPVAAMIGPIAVVILVLQIWGSYRLIASVFKWLTLALLAYIGAAYFAHPDPGPVLKGTLLPTVRFDHEFFAMLVAVLGTTISPYLWFWQASEEVEEEIAHGRKYLQQRKGATRKELRYAAWDVSIGMFFSNLVMYFIMLATSATLFAAGKTDIKSAAEAAEALRPFAGDAARVLLALGLVGSGFLAVPVLTGSGAYALSEAFGWRSGLNEPLARARTFYIVIAASTLIGMVINFVGINPIDALFWTAVINGVLAPPLLLVVMIIANDHKLMGGRTNGRALNVLGWLTTIAMFAAVIALVATLGS